MGNAYWQNTEQQLYKTIGQNIKTIRGRISQADLAACLGLAGPSSICDIEKGRVRISVAKLVDIAEFFGVKVDDLLKEPSQ